MVDIGDTGHTGDVHGNDAAHSGDAAGHAKPSVDPVAAAAAAGATSPGTENVAGQSAPKDAGAAQGDKKPDAKAEKPAEKTPPMTQEQLVDFAKSALDKSLEATIPDAAQRQAAVEKAATAFSEALSEGLKTLPKGASLKPETAAEIIATIQKEQAQWPDWNGKVGEKPIADIVKEAAQEFSKEQGTDKKTMGGRVSGFADYAKDHPAITAAGAAALTAAAAKFIPNKETEQPDGTVKKKMGFVKKVVVALLGVATVAAAVEYAKPGATAGAWEKYVTNRRGAAPAAGQGVSA